MLVPALDGRIRIHVSVVYGDGCTLGIASSSVDTVVNIQVLEHVFEPILMVEEIGRVLRPGGHAMFLIPQTSTMQLAPHFHQNFSRFWIHGGPGLELVELRPLGGIWSSMASHLVYFFFHGRDVGQEHPPQASVLDPLAVPGLLRRSEHSHLYAAVPW